jgi:AraC-like DNA-binding protein
MRLVQVVNDNLSSGQYGVETIASEMNMSVQTFRRRLMSVTGESPKAFISAIQMERAAKLLTDNPDMPISRVANLCGYDETNSFGRVFKRAYGVTPSQYRESLNVT